MVLVLALSTLYSSHHPIDNTTRDGGRWLSNACHRRQRIRMSEGEISPGQAPSRRKPISAKAKSRRSASQRSKWKKRRKVRQRISVESPVAGPADEEMSETLDRHIHDKFTVGKRIGKGAYGVVYRAKNRTTGDEVALKKIFDAFSNSTDAQRTFREVMFLQEFSQHSNIIKLQEILPSKNELDIYLVFEYMPTDLHRVIKMNVLKDVHKRSIVYQLLKAMKYIHSGAVIHRDLKPSNILLDKHCHVKVCDFGLARSILQLGEDPTNPALTDYVATRWYRAPEILLGSKSYTKGVDCWSIGCIVAELYIGKAVFPGTDSFNQVDTIARCLPTPRVSDIQDLDAPYARKMLVRQNRKLPQIPLESKLPGAKPDAVDLITSLLRWSPRDRLTTQSALAHQYVKQFQNPDSEISMTYDVVPPLKEDVTLTADQYRLKLYECMRRKNKRICTQQHRHVPIKHIRKSQLVKRPSTSSDEGSSDDDDDSSEDAEESEVQRGAESPSSSAATSARTASTEHSHDSAGRHGDRPAVASAAKSAAHAAPPATTVAASRASYRGKPRVSSASAAMAEARRSLKDKRHTTPASSPGRTGSSTADNYRHQPVAYTHSAASAMPGRNPRAQAQSSFGYKANPGTYDDPRKEPRLAMLSKDDYMKSHSAPNLAASGFSPTSHSRKPAPQPTSGSQIWSQSTRYQQTPAGHEKRPTLNRQITFNSWTQELHSTLVPAGGGGAAAGSAGTGSHRQPPPSRIARPVTKALDARQTAITRTLDPGTGHAPSLHGGNAGSGLANNRSAHRNTPTVDAARRSAALKAATVVSQSSTQSRRRQFGSENQFQRPPIGSYNASHGIITQSSLMALQRQRKP